MLLLKDQRKFLMNSSFEILGLIFNILNYAFVFLFIFNLLKVNYFNPIVSVFVKVYNYIVFPLVVVDIFLTSKVIVSVLRPS